MGRVLPLALVWVVGCQGAIEGSARPSGEGTSVGPADAVERAPFSLNREVPKLLPFHVRLGKVAAVLGVSVDAPVLAPLRGNRVTLGGYDFANGALPDTAWTASRVTEWVRALRPVCNSDEFRSRFPDLPEQLPALIEAAYGRESRVDDLADYDEALDDASLSAEERHELTCLAVLSSAEMVLQ